MIPSPVVLVDDPFDLRGVGLSDPIAPSSRPTLEQWTKDALAVLDAAGSERAAIFAPRDCLEAYLLVTAHPERERTDRRGGHCFVSDRIGAPCAARRTGHALGP